MDADGKTLLYQSALSPVHIWTLQPAESGGDSKPRLLFQANSHNESDAQVSPDGRWVAYTTDESGKNRVDAREFPVPVRGMGVEASFIVVILYSPFFVSQCGLNSI